MLHSDLPDSGPAVDPLQSKHRKLLRERDKKQAAEAQRDAEKVRADSAEQQVTELVAALDAAKIQFSELNGTIASLQGQADVDRVAAQAAAADARQAGFELGRLAQRAGVKASVTAAQIAEWPEASRKEMIDRAANPPSPGASVSTGSTLSDLGRAFSDPATSLANLGTFSRGGH